MENLKLFVQGVRVRVCSFELWQDVSTGDGDGGGDDDDGDGDGNVVVINNGTCTGDSGSCRAEHTAVAAKHTSSTRMMD